MNETYRVIRALVATLMISNLAWGALFFKTIQIHDRSNFESYMILNETVLKVTSKPSEKPRSFLDDLLKDDVLIIPPAPPSPPSKPKELPQSFDPNKIAQK